MEAPGFTAEGYCCHEEGQSSLASAGFSCCSSASLPAQSLAVLVPGEVTGPSHLLVDSVQGLSARGCVWSLPVNISFS